MRGIALWILLTASAAGAQTAERFLAPARDRAFLDGVVAAAAPAEAPQAGVTGLTVPHHLLAADLVARGFWSASAGRYSRVILIAPDHYRAVRGRFATSDQQVQTVYGPLEVDTAAVADLLGSGLFEQVNVFADHGLFALAPFVERFFPDAQIVPVLAAISTQPADWASAAEALAPLLGPDTLVVQSTDFSHYLDPGSAALHDSETLAAVATRDARSVERLRQPEHLDSRAAMALQMDLQARLGAGPTVVANRNSVDYGGAPDGTTSYLVMVWHRDPAATAALRFPDQEVLYFGGDILLGRYLTPHLRRPEARDVIVRRIRAITRGAPLIATLEGVLLDRPVAHAPLDSHLMALGLAGPLLQDLGVTALSIANNHSFDFGEGGYKATLAALRSLDILPLEHGQVADLGPLRVLPLNLLPGGREGVASFDPATICETEARGPLVVLPHWGVEYTGNAPPREQRLARDMAACAVSLIAGGHSHRASDRMGWEGAATQSVYSLGNLLFDQSGPRVSSVLLEVRIFRQGTLAARLIPVPNLFEEVAAPP